jgi:flagellar hook-associated protein 2
MINPRTIAKELAILDVSSRAGQLARQQQDLNAQSSGLDDLENALSSFQTAVDALDSSTDGPIVNTASSNQDTATITANSEAQAGTYTFFVDQIATAQQTTYSFADGDIPSSGTFSITMGDSEMDIDLSQSDEDGDGAVSVGELADAINDSEDNPGVTASIVKTNGSTTLMLTSDETGAASSFSVSASGIDANSAFATEMNSPKNLSTSQDAIIYLGSSAEDGIEITNSTNTFDDVIPGVSMTFTEPSEEGKPMTITVKNDEGATEEKVNTFVDAYNSLVDDLADLTKNGDAANNISGGPFAGDSGISALQSQIRNITHNSFDGVSIIDYGITLDKDGHLQVDSEKFDDEMEKNPDGLNNIFVGPGSMSEQIDDVLDTYLDDNNGIIMQRQATIDDRTDQIASEADELKKTYQTSYDRYLNEFTATMVEIESMTMSMAAFA